ncbi:hypothetical protein [Azospirillum lipoferum]|uniref:hypothetical protein n=1 Tax=Azospirillum lipoferum TaxID=193 RepID=UPI0013960A27|nr:hypothetical protein [Azospirillum lipoferum]
MKRMIRKKEPNSLDNDRSFQMRTDALFLAQVDDWRSKRSSTLSRAEAIRQMVAKVASGGGEFGDHPTADRPLTQEEDKR